MLNEMWQRVRPQDLAYKARGSVEVFFRKTRRTKDKRFRVFVASPGDVSLERECLPIVVARLNKVLGHTEGTYVDLWRWETNSEPRLGEPQQLINPEVDEADIVIVILWRRLGTPTASAKSGTEEEFARAFARWKDTGRPRVQVYVCRRPIPTEALESDDDILQLARVKSFLRSIRPMALMADYETPDELADLVHDNLQLAILELLAQATGLDRDDEAGQNDVTRNAQPIKDRTPDSTTAWQQEANYGGHERGRAMELCDKARREMDRVGYSREAQDALGSILSELLTNAITHALRGQSSVLQKITVVIGVSDNHVSMAVKNPPDIPIRLSDWLQSARARLEGDPYSPNGRGLLLVESLADELSAASEHSISATLYKDRVSIDIRIVSGITIVDVQRGLRNPSAPRRVGSMIESLSSERLILNLGSAVGVFDHVQADAIAARFVDATECHDPPSGFAVTLPHFRGRRELWRIVCASPYLRKLLPKGITHATLDEAVAALRSTDEEGSLVRLAMDLLDDRERRLLRAREVDGRDWGDIAREFGYKSADAARMAYNRTMPKVAKLVMKLRQGRVRDVLPDEP